jgi:hypothetical protein
MAYIITGKSACGLCMEQWINLVGPLERPINSAELNELDFVCGVIIK